jgi:MinD-like ATPase involved in chromosome partitioning or flagellar assembly
MPAKVFACISHKGGTGRTTTAANVAYRLALRNRSVCCVDLDLDSPTFGAVAGLRGMEQGAEIGIHDFLHLAGAS